MQIELITFFLATKRVNGTIKMAYVRDFCTEKHAFHTTNTHRMIAHVPLNVVMSLLLVETLRSLT